MKIQLQNILYYPALGGIENYIYNVSKQLVKKGHEPTILCSKHLKTLPDEEQIEGIHIKRHPYYKLPKIPFAPFNPIYYAKKLQYYLKDLEMDDDVIWSRYFYETYASCENFKGKIPIIFIQAAISPSLEKFSNSNNIITNFYLKILIEQYYLIEKKAVESCDKIITLSEVRMREIKDYYNLNENKFETVPPGVDLNLFRPKSKDLDLLKKMNIPIKSKIILSVCRLSNEKNIEMLIDAFNAIKDDNVYLVIVGDGIERNNLEMKSQRLRCKNRIIFVGFRRDTERFYSIADVFVLPSKYEGFGQVFLEAMASGVPCIGLKQEYPNIIVASDEIIKNGYNGYLADPYSKEDLARKIEKIIFDDKSFKLGKNARLDCEEKYSWQRVTEKLIEISKNI